MKKYERMSQELEHKSSTQAKVFGNSMVPLIESGSLTFERRESYEVGDIVFCKVKGRIIDAHKITKVNSEGGYLISNNHRRDNGWTKQIYGKVVQAIFPNGTVRIFS